MTKLLLKSYAFFVAGLLLVTFCAQSQSAQDSVKAKQNKLYHDSPPV